MCKNTELRKKNQKCYHLLYFSVFKSVLITSDNFTVEKKREKANN